MRRLFLGLLLLAGLTGCSGVQVLNTTTPDSGYSLASNLIYDEATNQRLDIYTPQNARQAPVVVFFYGGRWTEGNKEEYKFVGQALASQGFVVVIPDYRKYPAVRYPVFVQDGALAASWVRKNIYQYGGDSAKLFVMGHSSGAHIAAMLTLNESFLKNVGGSRGWLKGMIGLAGPYDFLPLTDPDLRDIFGPPEDFAQSQPIFYVDGQNPPLLLIHGEDDAIVWVKNTRNLASSVASAGGPVETVLYPKLSHSFIIASISRLLRGRSDVLQNITDFILRIASGKGYPTDMGGVESTALPPQSALPAPVPQPIPEPLAEPTPIIEMPSDQPAPLVEEVVPPTQ